jgi:hypothetical protein
VARAYTCVPGARTRQEFLAGLRAGRCIPAGRSGSYARLTSEVTRIFAAGYAETLGALGCGEPEPLRLLASLALVPLLPLVPFVTLAIHLHELSFGRRHFRAFQDAYGWPARTPQRRAVTRGLEEAA